MTNEKIEFMTSAEWNRLAKIAKKRGERKGLKPQQRIRLAAAELNFLLAQDAKKKGLNLLTD